jgi:uncharacterized protein YhbP (UPF0306 family)
MQTIDKRLVAFIREHHVLTLATSVNNEPYCASLFYAYWEAENLFVFASETKTKHAGDLQLNAKVALSIVLETKTIGLIRGLQMQGTLLPPDKALLRQARRRYLRRFPYALLDNSPLWLVRPAFFKFTDNRLGFGKKIIVTL